MGSLLVQDQFFFGTAHYAKYNTIQGVVSEFRPPSPPFKQNQMCSLYKYIWKEFFLLSSANSKYKLFKLLLNAITPPVKSNQ